MDILSSPTTALARLALDAAALRHLAIANNIANAGTPGHAPQRVNFEQQLGLVRQRLHSGQPLDAAALGGVRPFLESGRPSATDNSASPTARLDLDLVALAQNTLRYQALLRAIGRRGGIMATAINEGKR